jgi:hypothetical protein
MSDIADLADCNAETARDHLEWFDEMRLVHRHDGRPVRYKYNDPHNHVMMRWSVRAMFAARWHRE